MNSIDASSSLVLSSSWWNFINQYAVAICVVLSIVCLIFILFGHCYREQVQSKLKHEFGKFPESAIDWWSVSHLVLYAIFGFLLPERPLTFFALGLVFEGAEDLLSSAATTQLVDCNINKDMLWCKGGIEDDYWYMNPSDPWVNLTGYILGSAIRTTWF
jgi:hypothetical protein